MEIVVHGASAAGKVALAQVAGARIVGQSGTSTSWVTSKKNVAGIFAKFRDQVRPEMGALSLVASTRGAPRALISRDDATSRVVWEDFATYLWTTYTIPEGSRGAGGSVSIQTAQDYLKCAMNLAREIYKDADFFKCLDKNVDVSANDDRRWLMALRDQMWKAFYVRAVDNGDKIDQSANPVGLSHVTEMVRALSRYASAAQRTQARDGHARKFSILSLWHVAGRSGEIGSLSYKKLDWDEELQCLHVEVAQMKTTKTKRLVFSAGANRHICWFVAWGDRLTTETREAWFDDNDEYHWLFPDLIGTTSPGQRIGEYMKALVPHDIPGSSKKKEFEDYVVKTMPAHVSAASIRTGAANKLHMNMPEEFACTTTGHHLQSTAHQQYIDAMTANCMPGAVVLAGFPAFGWGQSGECAKPPSLAALANVPLVRGSGGGEVTFDTIIDALYRLSDFSPEVLRVGGRLRPAVNAAFASQVMYYEERAEERECSDVVRVMRDVLVAQQLARDASAAHSTLIGWGKLLRTRFNTVNKPLTMRETASQADQVVLSLTKMQSELEATRAINARLVERMTMLESSMAQVIESTASVGAGFNDLSKLVTGWATRAQPDAPVADLLGTAGEDGSRADVNAAVLGTEVGAAPQVGVISPRGAGAAAAAQPNALDVLMANADTAPSAPKSTAGLQARELVLNAWEEGGRGTRLYAGFERQAKAKVTLVMEVYNAVMTEEEGHLLNRPLNRERPQETRAEGMAIVNRVEERVVKMLTEWYEAAGKDKVPASLRPPKTKKTAKKRRVNGVDPRAAGARQPLTVNTMDELKRGLPRGTLTRENARAWWIKQAGTGSRAVETEGGEPAAALPAPEEHEVEQPAGSPSAWVTITSHAASFLGMSPKKRE